MTLLLNRHDRCRRNLAQVVQPFLDGVSKLTGYHITLLAGTGRPPDSIKYSLTTLHAGRTWVPGLGQKGLRFDEWEPELFKKKVMLHFMNFLLETNERKWNFACAAIAINVERCRHGDDIHNR
jgi:hypothetical protein